ncbi:hypothetical protein ALC56_04881 [Trachymyrmex septentrionalis]|uniref:Uncharacterized protein n=1 Tax=Trachymyrmex septentrionalis TaxID=34720 RepID=A0A195FJY5_9HYME|nr:hypothetical protein ALC56_04881 [Trachymyrmex septentrionalis]
MPEVPASIPIGTKILFTLVSLLGKGRQLPEYPSPQKYLSKNPPLGISIKTHCGASVRPFLAISADGNVPTYVAPGNFALVASTICGRDIPTSLA